MCLGVNKIGLTSLVWYLLLSQTPGRVQCRELHHTLPNSETNSISPSNARGHVPEGNNNTLIAKIILSTLIRDTPSKSGSVLVIFKDIDELIQSLARSLANNAPQIYRHVEQVLQIVEDRFANVLAEIRDEFVDASGDLLHDIFTGMHQHLIKLRHQLQNLDQSADEHFDAVVTHLNETLMNNTERIDIWTANVRQDLRSVKGTRMHNETCQILDDLITQSTIQLQRCCNVAIMPVQSMCSDVRAMLTEAFRVIADIIERMQTCFEDKYSYLNYMVPCIKVAMSDVSALIVRAANFKQKLVDSPMKIYYSDCCFSVMLVKVNRHANEG